MSKFNVDTAPRPERKTPLREWTALDHLTHDFMNCAGYREHCLRERGQYVTHDGKRVTA